MKIKIGLLFVSLFLCVTFALAADEPKVAASHDGQVRKIGENYVELVAKDGKITLYFTDDKNNKISTEFGQARATIRHGDDRQTISVDLRLAQGNTLQGKGDFEIKPDTAIVVFVKLDGETHPGRFVLNESDQ